MPPQKRRDSLKSFTGISRAKPLYVVNVFTGKETEGREIAVFPRFFSADLLEAILFELVHGARKCSRSIISQWNRGLQRRTAKCEEQDALWDCLAISQAVKSKVVVSWCAALNASQLSDPLRSSCI